ncbi:MAG TPA: tripartite tricarboxylate transporter TctB family protein [Candidatus Omnitrophota bacterium]|nr:tripartite tricarboxylate transporter TctB family protein [Candidatus Omnitrophota bacterium]
MNRTARLIRQAAVPALFLVAALILPRYILPSPEMADLAGEGAGPTLWPSTMLILIAVCAFLWLVGIVVTNLRNPRPEVGEPAEKAPYNAKLAWAGVALTFVYGYAIQQLGFAIATLIFLALWFILGGVRRPVTVGPVAVLGTLVLLWVFVALAQMPLDRGRGVFTAATDEIYDAIGIY